METVTSGMRPIHLGEVLCEEFIRPLGITAHALFMALQVPAPRIHEILHERRSVTVDTALRFSRYFGTSAEFWFGLQADYDMAIARSTIGKALRGLIVAN
jgi:addiction module HigA family antidote